MSSLKNKLLTLWRRFTHLKPEHRGGLLIVLVFIVILFNNLLSRIITQNGVAGLVIILCIVFIYILTRGSKP